MNITAVIDDNTRLIDDIVTHSEIRRFASSMLIDLTEGTRTVESAKDRAFRGMWSHRLGYSSRLSAESLETLTEVARRLNVSF